MKIRVTFEIDATQRRSIANHYGFPGLADYETAKQFLTNEGMGGLESLIGDYDPEAEDDDTEEDT